MDYPIWLFYTQVIGTLVLIIAGMIFWEYNKKINKKRSQELYELWKTLPKTMKNKGRKFKKIPERFFIDHEIISEFQLWEEC